MIAPSSSVRPEGTSIAMTGRGLMAESLLRSSTDSASAPVSLGTGAHDAVDPGVCEEHFGPCGRVLDGAQRLSAEVNDAHDRGRNLARDVEHVAVQISLRNRLINALFSSSRA